MRTLIATTGKTGSTAVAYLLSSSLPGHELVFEPHRLHHVSTGPNVVCKYFLKTGDSRNPLLATFDRIVLLVRHPFDLLVSDAMYMPYSGGGFVDDHNMAAYLDLIERRIAVPSEVTFRDVVEHGERRLERRPGEVCRALELLYELAAARPGGIFILKYEDFVDRNLSDLEAYLGCSLDASKQVPSVHGRVRRTAGYGDWSNWFSDEDIRYFSGIEGMQKYAVRFGYSTERPSNSSRNADAGSGVAYICRLVGESRKRWRLPPFDREALAFRDPGGHLGRAIIAHHGHGNPKVMGELAAAEKILGPLPAISYLRALTYSRADRHEQAAAEFEKALESLGGDYEILVRLAQSRLASGQPRLALVAIERAISLDPSRENAHAVARRVYHALETNEQAQRAPQERTRTT